MRAMARGVVALALARALARALALALVLEVASAQLESSASTSTFNGATFKLVWADEFSQPDGSSPDPAWWTPSEGPPNNGNGELEVYTNATANLVIEDSKLVITALEQKTVIGATTFNFTSGRIQSASKFQFQFGLIEASIRVPPGAGMWPAFWLLGADIETVGWPACGEIDVMEIIGVEPSVVHGTVHGPGYSGANGITNSHALASGAFWQDFHVFTALWTPASIEFFVDRELYGTVTPAELPRGAAWVFDAPFFVLLNLAVGGGWPGPPNATTPFPAVMEIDYVRVYEQAPPPAGALAPLT